MRMLLLQPFTRLLEMLGLRNDRVSCLHDGGSNRTHEEQFQILKDETQDHVGEESRYSV